MSSILIVEDDRSTRHLLAETLKSAGFSVASAKDGAEALKRLSADSYDLMLLDVWMPKMNGLDVLAALPPERARPRVVVMTSDDTPETLLRAVRQQAWRYVSKPVEPQALVELLNEVMTQKAVAPAIEVVSARPDWVELLVPCERAVVDRIESFMAHLEGDLPVDVRESVGYAFRELLMNAIEWGGGLDPSRTVRVAFLRAKRMLLYRIADPGPGFNLEGLLHAAVGQPEDDPTAHTLVREEKGMRPGGFGILTVRARVDELLYNEKRNEVVFVKYLD
ncbi:MAG: response regulator [Acidobacteria bacterium]|nr:response regulator [Acidobacteriota bacterium]MCA1652071.1 response regulator [Acidobacteriota bacterium]